MRLIEKEEKRKKLKFIVYRISEKQKGMRRMPCSMLLGAPGHMKASKALTSFTPDPFTTYVLEEHPFQLRTDPVT